MPAEGLKVPPLSLYPLDMSTVLVITENLVTGNVVCFFLLRFPRQNIIEVISDGINYLQFVSLSRAITIEKD